MNEIDKMNYDEALQKLKGIVDLLEKKEVKVDQLPTYVKQAKELVDHCRKKLTATEDEISKIISPT